MTYRLTTLEDFYEMRCLKGQAGWLQCGGDLFISFLCRMQWYVTTGCLRSNQFVPSFVNAQYPMISLVKCPVACEITARFSWTGSRRVMSMGLEWVTSVCVTACERVIVRSYCNQPFKSPAKYWSKQSHFLLQLQWQSLWRKWTNYCIPYRVLHFSHPSFGAPTNSHELWRHVSLQSQVIVFFVCFFL